LIFFSFLLNFFSFLLNFFSFLLNFFHSCWMFFHSCWTFFILVDFFPFLLNFFSETPWPEEDKDAENELQESAYQVVMTNNSGLPDLSWPKHTKTGKIYKRGQYYDRYFRRFFENRCCGKYLHKIGRCTYFETESTFFLIFLRKYFKNHNIDPPVYST
jgi:hypothetical protein